MGYTLVTHFRAEDYQKMYKLLECIKDETVCRVPYGRVEDKKRYASDTLPYHATMSSSKEHLSKVLQHLSDLTFETFEMNITGIGEMRGKNDSKILYFIVESNRKIEALQKKLYKRLANEKYLPGKSRLHITICITKDAKKHERIKSKLLANFTPFSTHVMSLGLYKIWPGKLVSEYHSQAAFNVKPKSIFYQLFHSS